MRGQMLQRVFGFRSGTSWKSTVAVIYYIACLAAYGILLTTPPLVECGLRDRIVLRISVTILFIWAMSPALLMSDTPLRERLPLFRRNSPTGDLCGMLVACLIFVYLFAWSESFHTKAYKIHMGEYLQTAYAQTASGAQDGSAASGEIKLG